MNCQRACTRLFRRAAQSNGPLAGDDVYASDGVTSAAAAAAIETLPGDKLDVPEPSEKTCRRHYAANQSSFSTGEKIHARQFPGNTCLLPPATNK